MRVRVSRRSTSVSGRGVAFAVLHHGAAREHKGVKDRERPVVSSPPLIVPGGVSGRPLISLLQCYGTTPSCPDHSLLSRTPAVGPGSRTPTASSGNPPETEKKRG